MRVLALDIGARRVGVAVSDPSGRVATPARIIDTRDLRDAGVLQRLIQDYEPELLLVGLPLSLDGTEGPQARRVRAEASALSERVGLPVQFADERLTTSQAARVMQEVGMSERDRRGKLDAVAASLFLQAWLDGRRKEGTDGKKEA